MANLYHFSALQDWLETHIPAYKSLGLELEQADNDEVSISCNLEKNRNHHGTIFGGSQSLLATACSWLAVHLNFPLANANIVIQQSNMRYVAPAKNKVIAVCKALTPEQLEHCQKMLDKFGKGRINVECQLICDNRVISIFNGEFVIFQ